MCGCGGHKGKRRTVDVAGGVVKELSRAGLDKGFLY